MQDLGHYRFVDRGIVPCNLRPFPQFFAVVITVAHGVREGLTRRQRSSVDSFVSSD